MLLKLLKRGCMLLGLMAAQHAGAFTLWGPLEAWQTADLDYSAPAGTPRYYYFYVQPGLQATELGGPKNFGEGSRLTSPIVTYGFDATFSQYFGVQGEAAVVSAMAVLNALPASTAANLNNYLTEGVQQVNYTAQALELLDLKSTVLYLMAEHMGLLGETHVWDLAERVKYDSVNTCDYEYAVINRNYDTATYNPSAYVNGRLYGWYIWDGCNVGVSVGDAIEIPLDAAASRYSAVATGPGLELGAYYLNFSRDDVGGLKYLYNPANYAFQGLDSNAVALPFSSSWLPVNTTNEITGISNFDGLLGGVNKITFVRVNFDSQLNPGFTPVTYKYSVPWVTNSHLGKLSVTRTVTVPDIIFTAANLIVNAAPFNDAALARSGGFIQTTYVSPGGGVTPSTIASSELITLNNAGPIYIAYNPSFLDSLNYLAVPVFNWASFDGSTNAPIIYPNGTSLAELEAQVIEGGTIFPANPWAPILNPNTNAVTTGATGGGGGNGGAPASVH